MNIKQKFQDYWAETTSDYGLLLGRIMIWILLAALVALLVGAVLGFVPLDFSLG